MTTQPSLFGWEQEPAPGDAGAVKDVQRMRGGFYTPPDVARAVAQRTVLEPDSKVLEPSCGDGAFLGALRSMRAVRRIEAVELDAQEAAKARKRMPPQDGPACEVVNAHFLRWARQQPDEVYDAAVGNPPFISYRLLSPSDRALLKQRSEGGGFMSFWMAFVDEAMRMLKPGGRLGMVVPSEIIHSGHAQALRGKLAMRSSSIDVIELPPKTFAEAEKQGTCILLAHKGGDAERPAALRLVRLPEPWDWRRPLDEVIAPAREEKADWSGGFWTMGLLSPKEYGAWSDALAQSKRLRECAAVHGAKPTGENKFFEISWRDAVACGVESWAKPVAPSGKLAPGFIVDEACIKAADELDRQFRLLRFHGPDGDKALHRLRSRRKGAGTPQAAKMAARPNQAPIGLPRRCTVAYKMMLVTAPDCSLSSRMMGVVPRAGTDAAGLVSRAAGTLTALSAELYGNWFGGGVLELGAEGAGKLVIPAPDGADLQSLHQRRLAGAPLVDVMLEQDELLLKPMVGDDACRTIQDAWRGLCQWRFRGASGLGGGKRSG